jgi:hypothetical protein
MEKHGDMHDSEPAYRITVIVGVIRGPENMVEYHGHMRHN